VNASGRARAPLAAATFVAAVSLVTSCAGAKPAPSAADLNSGLWPDRPRVALSFDVAPDLASATGKESVTFTPDTPTCELDFRAWPNNPPCTRPARR